MPAGIKEDLDATVDMGLLVHSCEELRHLLARFDPALCSARQCAEAVEVLARLSKAAALARTRAAARAAKAGEHKRLGYAGPAQWVARQGGTSLSQARAELACAEALEAVPAALEAAAAGELSLPEATEVARAEAAVPGSATGALDKARREGLGALREHSRKLVLGSVPPEALHRHQYRARYLRHWVDGAGMTCLSAALAPEVGAVVVKRLQTYAARAHRAARGGRSGSSEGRDSEAPGRFEAHLADALVDLVSGAPDAEGRRGRAEVCIVVDATALARGAAVPGELCHIPGSGPVPVRLARDALVTGAFVKALAHDGKDITRLAHYGRHLPAELRSALELGRPPDFDGAVCANTGCGSRFGLQWDHVVPYVAAGPTSYANLQPLCWTCHATKTEADRKAGLLRPESPPPNGRPTHSADHRAARENGTSPQPDRQNAVDPGSEQRARRGPRDDADNGQPDLFSEACARSRTPAWSIRLRERRVVSAEHSPRSDADRQRPDHFDELPAAQFPVGGCEQRWGAATASAQPEVALQHLDAVAQLLHFGLQGACMLEPAAGTRRTHGAADYSIQGHHPLGTVFPHDHAGRELTSPVPGA